jgi:D-alanine-D-alanine ligase
MKVCVLKGGISGERQVSLRSGAAVANALRQIKDWQVDEFDITSKDFATPDADVLFIALHGTYGEDGELQARLEKEGRVFTGPGSKACALAMDKLATKEAFAAAGVPTPRGGLWHAGMKFDPPYVLKPVSEGSSLGLSMVYEASQVAEAERVSLEFGRPMMIEEMIQGRELTVGVLGGQALPITTNIPQGWPPISAQLRSAGRRPGVYRRSRLRPSARSAHPSCRVWMCSCAARTNFSPSK